MNLLDTLVKEKKHYIKGGIYHKLQVELTYNSNRIEGSKLSIDQTRYIYETNTIGVSDKSVDVNDIVETVNHFSCINKVLEHVNDDLNEQFIKTLHFILKNGTSDSRNEWFVVGDYKTRANEVGGKETTRPQDVTKEIIKIIDEYNSISNKTLNDIIEFHYMFEKIHPFQDGNGRVGRLIMLKECLRYNIIPFMIDEELKLFYYRGLSKYDENKGYLIDTCLTAQDKFKKYLDYFEIDHN